MTKRDAHGLPEGLAAWCRDILASDDAPDLPEGAEDAMRYVVGIAEGSGEPTRGVEGGVLWEVGYAHACMLVMLNLRASGQSEPLS